MFRQGRSIASIAALVLITAIAGGADGGSEGREKYLDKLVEDLRSDSVSWNALRAQEDISRLRGEDARAMRNRLIRALDSPDRQQRQLAAMILVAGSTRAEKVNPEDWPPRVMDVLIEALTSDEICGHRHGRPNAWTAFHLFSRMNESLPVDRLREVLAEGDRQARYLAAVLLAQHRPGTVQPDVSAVLLENLKDDRVIGNAVTAYTYVLLLGRENLERLLKRATAEDWQQAAYLQIAAIRLRVKWKAPRRFMDEWARMPADASWRSRQLASYALFVHPDCKTYFGDTAMPRQIEVWYRRTAHIEDPERRVDWLMSLYQRLKPDEASEHYRWANASGPLY